MHVILLFAGFWKLVLWNDCIHGSCFYSHFKSWYCFVVFSQTFRLLVEVCCQKLNIVFFSWLWTRVIGRGSTILSFGARWRSTCSSASSGEASYGEVTYM